MKKPFVYLVVIGMALALSACAWEREENPPPGYGAEGPKTAALSTATDLAGQTGLALRLAVDEADQLAVRVGEGEDAVFYQGGGEAPLPNNIYLIPLDSAAAQEVIIILWDSAGDELFRQELSLEPGDFQNGLLPDLAYICVSGSPEAGYEAQLVANADLWAGGEMPGSAEQQLAALSAWNEAEYWAFRDLPLVGSPEQISQMLGLMRASTFVRRGSEIVDCQVLWVKEQQTLEQDVYLYDMAWGVRPADPENERYLVGGQYVDEQGYIRDDRFNLRVLSLNEDGTYTDLGSPAFDLALQEGLKAMLDTAYQRGEAADLGAYNESEYRFSLHHGKGDFTFTLGRVFGAYPWGNEDLADLGQAVICGDDPGVDCYAVTIPGEQGQTWLDWYTVAENGRSYISRLRTTDPAVYGGAVGCGMNEPRLLSTYPDVAEKPELQPGGEESWCDFDKAYVFESRDYRPGQEIRYYVKDGFISGIEMKILLD